MKFWISLFIGLSVATYGLSAQITADSSRIIHLFNQIYHAKTRTFGEVDSLLNKALEESRHTGRVDYQIKICHFWSKVKLERNELDTAVALSRLAVSIGLGDNKFKTSAYVRDAVTHLSMALVYQSSIDSSRMWIARGLKLSRGRDVFNESVLLVLDCATRNYTPEQAVAKLDSAITLATQTESKHDDVMAILNKAEVVRVHRGWQAYMETLLSAQYLVNDKSLTNPVFDISQRIRFHYRQPKITLIRLFQQTYLALFDVENVIRYQSMIIKEYYDQGNLSYVAFPLIELAQLKTLTRVPADEILLLTDSASTLHKKYTGKSDINYPAYYYIQGWMSEKKKNYKEAIDWYEKGWASDKTDPYSFGLNLAALVRANSLANRTDQVDSLLALYATIKPQDDPSPFVRLVFERADHDKRQGRTLSYLQNQVRALKMKDSLSMIGRYYASKEIETKFRLQENDLKLKQTSEIQELQRAELKKRDVLILCLIFGITLLVALAVITFYLYRARKTQALELAVKNEKVSTLVRELHHRVKNNMQTISSILSLQSYGVQDEMARAVLQESRSRVDAMSIIHQKLYMDDDVRDIDIEEYLHTMVNMLAQSYGFDSSVVTNTVDPNLKSMDVDLAIPLGLIINELVINAFKHAFENVLNPTLNVSLTQYESHIHLTVKDNGAGISQPATNNLSFGMKLIRTLAKQLNASFSYHNENGAVFELVVHMPSI